MSRAGLIGGAIGLATFVVFARKRITRRGALILTAGLGGAAVMSLTSPTVGRLMMRAQETTELGDWGRPAIWRDAWRMASDFWLTGVGAGAFERGMLVSQQGSRQFFFNHAHDEYLQIATEGGLLLAIPAAAAIIAAIALMTHYLRSDRTAIFWLRAGAVSGIIAVAVQSIWDTGLRTPANGVLFAVVAAAAVYEPSSGRTPRAGHDSGVSRR
jgi:O-antigen ligase